LTLQADFFIGKVLVANQDRRILILANLNPGLFYLIVNTWFNCSLKETKYTEKDMLLKI
jgi:hypothetical protein